MSFFLRKYGTGTGADAYIPIIKRAVVDFAVGADWTPASGDVKVSLDGGAAANIGTLPVAVAMGNTAYWKFVFSDAELQCKVLTVTVADSATKAIEDQAFTVETYGHASAKFIADLTLANLPANLVQISGDTQSVTDLKDFADAGYDPSANKVTGVVLVDTLTTYTGNTPQTADHTANIAAILVDTGTTLDGKLDTIDNFLDTEIAAIITTLGTPAGASIAADLLTIDNLVDGLESTIGVAGAGLTDLGGFSTTAQGQIDTVVDTALAAINLDHLVKAAVPVSFSGSVHANSILGYLAATSATTSYSRTTDSLEAQRDNIGTAGVGLTSLGDVRLDNIGFIQTDVTAILADTNELQTDDYPTSIAAVKSDTAAILIDTAEIGAAGAGLTALATASALAALALYASRTVVRGTVGSATTPSTTQFTPSALSPSGVAADQFKSRICVFDNDTTTTALRGQATDITANSAAALPLFTFTALTTAPASGDTFSIV